MDRREFIPASDVAQLRTPRHEPRIVKGANDRVDARFSSSAIWTGISSRITNRRHASVAHHVNAALPRSSIMNSPIVLIHGLWLTPRSWEGWKARFEQRGHEVLAPAWPGNFNPRAAKVDVNKDDRAPLLVLGNEKDHTVPALV